MTKFAIFFVLSLLAWAPSTQAHETIGPKGNTDIKWDISNISRVIGAGYGESFGLDAYVRQGLPEKVILDGRTCYRGSYFAFDVHDRFAFNANNTVKLTVLLHTNHDTSFSLAYDKNGQAETGRLISADLLSSNFASADITLENARFANRGHAGTDFIIVAQGADSWNVQLDKTHQVALCDVAISKDGKIPGYGKDGRLSLTIKDETGQVSPARLGLYSTYNGRMPLPSKDAVTFQYYGERKREHFLREGWGYKEPWPNDNRYIFYTNGKYKTELPSGEYQLVVSHGPEYRVITDTIEITAGETLKKTVDLKRWKDLPGDGWYSGDGHIHLKRDKRDNKSVAAFLAAEDIRLSNILQMGNPSAIHYPQYAFGKSGQYMKNGYALAPGVEDPRTAQRGHTIALNIQSVVRDPAKYFLYHHVFEDYLSQGALTGYAHVGFDWFAERRGLALDLPFGLIKFLEVLQYGTLSTDPWYDFLNLGYEISPLAGSDFPYIDQPGTVRSYVKIDGEFTPQAWFDGLAAGKTFVTNGPVLTFSIDGQTMGSTLNVTPGDKIEINASADVNPDLDPLDRLELVSQGKVIASVSAKEGGTPISLSQKLTVTDGQWLAVRAYGKSYGLAHSAPIYVHVDDLGHIDARAAAAIVDKQLEHLDDLAAADLDPIGELEYWQVVEGLDTLWQSQKPQMIERVAEARERYEALLMEIADH